MDTDEKRKSSKKNDVFVQNTMIYELSAAPNDLAGGLNEPADRPNELADAPNTLADRLEIQED